MTRKSFLMMSIVFLGIFLLFEFIYIPKGNGTSNADQKIQAFAVDMIDRTFGWQQLYNICQENNYNEKAIKDILVQKNIVIPNAPKPLGDFDIDVNDSFIMLRFNSTTLYIGVKDHYTNQANGFEPELLIPHNSLLISLSAGHYYFLAFSFVVIYAWLAVRFLCKTPDCYFLMRREFIVVSIAIVTMFIISLFFVNPIPRNYFTSSHEVITVLEKKLVDFNSWVEKQPIGLCASPSYLAELPKEGSYLDIQLLPKGPQERNVGVDKIFVSKSPIFKDNYVRVNIDLFNYVFYAPTMTKEDLKKYNFNLTYTPYGKGIWLGQNMTMIMGIFLFQIANLGAIAVVILLWIMYFKCKRKHKTLSINNQISLQ